MTPVVEKLVTEVHRLPEAQRQEVIIALQRAKTEPRDLPNGADLVAAADALFQELDRRGG